MRTGQPEGQLRVLFTCGREPSYVRNLLILRALKRQCDVAEVTDASRSYVWRHLRLLTKYPFWGRPHDVAFVGFYGYLLTYLARLASRPPIVLDAYLSTYDTLCFDRLVYRPESPAGRLAYWVDRLACQLADIVLVDTRAHQDYFAATYGLPPEKLVVVYLGFDEELFYPRVTADDGVFRVFYYGSFLPLQGVEYVIRAAKLLEGERDVTFQIGGRGLGYPAARALASREGCANVEFLDWIPYHALPAYIAGASVCLGGHFSDRAKARRVIATKTYQFLAMGRPTIVGRCPANQELFADGEHVLMCEMASPTALADAIVELKSDANLRRRLGESGCWRVRETAGPDYLARSLASALTLAVGHRGPQDG